MIPSVCRHGSNWNALKDSNSFYANSREAKDKNRESWYMAYIMDTNEEEREKGKTVEVSPEQLFKLLLRSSIS